MDEQLVRGFLQPNSAAWAVHADTLQARGDPRGELIAIELRLDGDLPEVERQALEAEAERLRAPYVEAFRWRLAQDELDTRRVRVRWRFGYLRGVELPTGPKLEEEGLAAALNGEHSRFLAELRVDVYGKLRPSVVEALCARPRPIQALTLNVVLAHGRDEPISAAEGAALMHALPYLRSLALAGRRSFARLEHPELESLQISGHDSIVELHDAALPRLRELDLALVCGWGNEPAPDSGADPDRLAALFEGPATAQLSRLDLSRNNPGAREHTRFLGGDEPGVLFEVLARTSVCARLEQLSLPSPNDRRFDDAVAMLGLVPQLRMPRLYTQFSPPRALLLRGLPTLEIELEYPHRPFAHIDHQEHLSIIYNSTGSGYFFGIRRFSKLLERRYAQLSDATRAILDQLSAGLDQLRDEDEELVLELGSLRAAIAELEHEVDRTEANMLELLEMLEQRAQSTVTIRRMLLPSRRPP